MSKVAVKIVCGFSLMLCGFCLVSCTPPPPVNDSRDILWRQFAHQPVDNLLMAWGPPAAETRLTNGSRMMTYRHATIYDFSPSTGCEVSFLAPAPHYRIENIAMTGDPYECHLLAQGSAATGTLVICRRLAFTPTHIPIVSG